MSKNAVLAEHYSDEAKTILARIKADEYTGDNAEESKAADSTALTEALNQAEEFKAAAKKDEAAKTNEDGVKSDAERLAALLGDDEGKSDNSDESKGAGHVKGVPALIGKAEKPDEEKSAGELFLSKSNLGDLTKEGGFKSEADALGLTGTVGYKSLLTSPSVPVTQRYENYAPAPHRLLDAVRVVPIGATSLRVHRLIRSANNAGALSSNVNSPESDFTWQTVTLTVDDVGHHVPVDVETLNDHPSVEAMVNVELADGVRDKVEADIMTSIDGTTGLLTEAFATDVPTTILNAITTVEDVEQGGPTHIIMNPADHNALLLAKGTDNHYIGNGFLAGMGLSPWGIPVIRSSKCTAGFAYIGRMSRVLWRARQDITIETGWVNDQFTKRQLTMQATVRGFTDVTLPGAMVKADLTA